MVTVGFRGALRIKKKNLTIDNLNGITVFVGGLVYGIMWRYFYDFIIDITVKQQQQQQPQDISTIMSVYLRDIILFFPICRVVSFSPSFQKHEKSVFFFVALHEFFFLWENSTIDAQKYTKQIVTNFQRSFHQNKIEMKLIGGL